MYVYKITNQINKKSYIGITNNIKKRWSNECTLPNDPKKQQVIQRAIARYGKENFTFEILYKNLSLEDACKYEAELAIEYNAYVPNGYNVAPCGEYHPACRKDRDGADNPNANLTEEEAQYILDHRNQPIYLLYEQFQDKLTYNSFLKIYHHQTYKNLTTNIIEYPNNRSFSCQFTSGPLEYDDVIELRERYARGEYWRTVYEDYKWAYSDEWTFWNVYYGNRYKLVMPEVFTPENRKKHSKFSNHSGEANGRSKLTADDVRYIRKRWHEGCTRQELYQRYP